MGERRYTEQEEALEIKSLRRIIAAYAKYAHPSRLLFYPGELAPIHSYGVTAAAVDLKCINGGTRCYKRFRVLVQTLGGWDDGLMGWPGVWSGG